mgnify:CR=1 FL=1
MEFWEFLIQKDGDRSWIALESPKVEILEGRYRVVARSSRVNTPVEIRVTHEAIAETPPKRRIQKRTARTNPDGLIVVIPFTRLQSGIWELRCTGDLMADMMGEGWRYVVKLHIISHESVTDEWEPDWLRDGADIEYSNEDNSHSAVLPLFSEAPSDNRSPEETASFDSPAAAEETCKADSIAMELPETDSHSDSSESPNLEQSTGVDENEAFFRDRPADSAESGVDPSADAIATQLAEQVMDSVFEPLDTPDQRSTLEERSESVAEPSDAAILSAEATIDPAATWQLHLKRTSYRMHQGEALTLEGQVIVPAAIAETVDYLSLVQLEVQLRDPQTAQVMVHKTHSFLVQRTGGAFSLLVDLPNHAQTRLMLGEVVLRQLDAATPAPVLASQSFSVTVNLEDLLEAIANDFTDSDLLPPLEFVKPSPDADLNLTFLNLLDAPKPPLQTQPSDRQVLPPLLHRPEGDRPSAKPLELPFSGSKPPAAVVEAVEQSLSATGTATTTTSEPRSQQSSEPQSESRPAVPPASPPDPEAAIAPQPHSSTDVQPIQDAEDDFMTPESDLEFEADPEVDPIEAMQEPELPPETAAFRALNLRNRFWSRLNSMASDPELTSLLRRVDPLSTPSGQDAPLSSDSILADQEVVIEDDPLPVPGRFRRQLCPVPEPEEMSPPILDPDDPVPAPTLSVPEGELTAGRSLYVVVQVPDLPSRLYVKFWLRDRQTRLLLDGPKWVVSLLPTGQGTLEARTQIAVPFGCLEVQFEAIAVEMATQRESDRVTLHRTVTTPDLPSLSLDFLDDLSL